MSRYLKRNVYPSSEEDHQNFSDSTEDEESSYQSDIDSQSDESYGNNAMYFWYVELTLNKIIIRDRIYRSKHEAIKVVTNSLKNFDNSDASKLAREVSKLPTGPRDKDDISLKQGKYAVEIRRVAVYD
jgi:hypothetical protein